MRNSLFSERNAGSNGRVERTRYSEVCRAEGVRYHRSVTEARAAGAREAGVRRRVES
jgi:hypothetical protein